MSQNDRIVHPEPAPTQCYRVTVIEYGQKVCLTICQVASARQAKEKAIAKDGVSKVYSAVRDYS